MTDPKVVICVVSADPLDVAAHDQAVQVAGAGAHVVFCGVVRDFDHGRTVTELEYEAHPRAVEVLAEVAAEFAARSEVHRVAVSHRIGPLKVGDAALVVAISTAHRSQAFELCSQLVDQVKLRLPIWKRQVFADGTDEWVNFP